MPRDRKSRKACLWTENDLGIWETACGNAFELTTGTPAENRFAFCPYCGACLQEGAA